MRANRAYRLIARRGGWTPALLADPERIDHIEVVEVATGEAVLFWDLTPLQATQRARALRADLSQLQDEEFIARWASVEH